MERGDSIQVVNAGAPETLNQRQDRELLAWIDEFLESQEYADALARKLHEHEEGEGSAHQGSEYFEDVSIPEKHRNTHKDIVLLDAKVQRSLEKLQIQKTIANQLAGVAIIRQKIADVKREFKAREQSKYSENAAERFRALSMLEKKFGVILSSHELTPALLKKIQLKNALETNTNKTTLDNRVKIFRNIVKEMRKDPFYSPRKRQAPKVKRISIKKHQRKTNPPIVVKQIDSQQEESVKNEENPELQTITDFQEESKPQNFEETSRISLNEAKIKLKTRNGKKCETFSHTSLTTENVFPAFIPKVNSRKKTVPSNVINQLLKDFHNLHKYLDTKKKLEEGLLFREDVNLPTDEGFFCRPDKVIFRDFEQGKSYKKSTSLVNGNANMRIIRFYHIVWNSDIQEELLMYVEPFGACRVKPGLSTKMTLRFTPEILAKTIDGKIIFITEDTRLEQKFQFVVHFVCVPLCAAVTIDPVVISFEETPIWRARSLKSHGKNFKLITIKNAGMKECKVVISKIFNTQTIEQEWKKIIGIIRIEIPDSTPSLISSSTLEDPSTATPFPRDLVQQCVENVFNTFVFERNIFSVPPKSSKAIKCWLKDMCEARYQAESFMFSIYERFSDGQLYCVGTQDVIVNSETTSHFLSVSCEVVDFELCVYGSVYQVDFDVSNPCHISHHIQICFPSAMKRYLQTKQGSISIQAKQKVTIFIKFLPQLGILQNNKFYDDVLGILEFPIYIRTITKGYEDTPALKVDAFAVVTIAKGVSFSPVYSPMVTCTKNTMLVDLGTCTTVETISTSFTLINTSLVPQNYGFLNVPEFITLKPNYGFGRLLPMSKTTLEIELSPEKADVLHKSGELRCSLYITTVKYSGALKKRFKAVDLSEKSKEIENYVYKSSGSNCTKLKHDIKALNRLIRHNPSEVEIGEATSTSMHRLSQVLEKSDVFSLDESSPPSEDESEELIFTLNLHVNVQDPLVQFSHQILTFPNTPAGSWSMMEVDLCARKYGKVKYTARYEISGENDEFRMQPNYGELQAGDTRKMCVIIKPKLPQAIIEARENFAGKSKTVVESDVAVVASRRKVKASKNKLQASLVTLSNEEYYRGEMDVWESTCPYMIEKTFKCRISYNSPNSAEEIYLRATCKVVQPSFVHNQKLQIIDFGQVPMGSKCTRTIDFQNIKRDEISIAVSPISPIGSFYSPFSKRGLAIPSGLNVSYPIVFRPFEETQEIEYIDAYHDGTMYTFLLRGVGLPSNIQMNPDVLVCRLSAPVGGHAMFAFELLNNHNIELKLILIKLCQLEGPQTACEIQVEKNKKKKKKDKSKPEKKATTAQLSNELFDDEITAIENHFEKCNHSSLFEVTSNDLLIPPYGKQTITIRFGEEAANKSKKSSKSNLKANSNVSQVSDVNYEKIYICKYNIFVNGTFLRDLIIVGSFS